MNDSIFKKVAQHVTGLFEEYPHPNLFFHNLEHTKKVVERAQEIAAHYQLNENDMLTLYVAAWFHDTGHLFSDIATHEEKSVELMREFMAHHNAEESLIRDIEACILVTKMPHEPENQLQEIMCDADTYHLGTKEFRKTNKLVKKEYRLRNYAAITIDWEKNTLDLLEKHQYFTSYCQVLLAEGKHKNIERVRRKYLKETNAANNGEAKAAASDPKVAKQQLSLVARGIQTMLRLTSGNHLELSRLADGKANILISVNAIIISVVLSVLFRKLDVAKNLTIPALIFLTFSVATIIISILATVPKVSKGRFTKADVINKKINLLFFGNFYKSTLEEYEWGMDILMKDKEYLYGSLVKDIYQLGVVLGRKYKLIRLAYAVFMIGIIVSVLAFTLAALLVKPEELTTVTMPHGTPL